MTKFTFVESTELQCFEEEYYVMLGEDVIGIVGKSNHYDYDPIQKEYIENESLSNWEYHYQILGETYTCTDFMDKQEAAEELFRDAKQTLTEWHNKLCVEK